MIAKLWHGTLKRKQEGHMYLVKEMSIFALITNQYNISFSDDFLETALVNSVVYIFFTFDHDI